LDEEKVKQKLFKPGETVIIADVTWISDDCGLMVFRCAWRKKNLLRKYVDQERIEDYRAGIDELSGQGWKILGLVCDGRRGMFRAFEEIPVQMCQFHQVKIITRYTTKRPKLEAGKELRNLVLLLKKTDRASFTLWLEQWHEKWKEFLKEKTHNPETGR
jgi:hypothetical protein